MSTLLDTNVLSELLKPAPSPAVMAWFGAQPASSLFVSAVTQAEMMLGASLLPAGKRKNALERALAQMFEDDFAQRVLPFDTASAAAYVQIVAKRRSMGRPIAQFDAQIAAIAQQAGATLATRNTNDFQHCGIGLLDPWKHASN